MMKPAFSTLQTERLLLRPVEASDQELVFTGLSDPEVTKFLLIHYPTWEASNLQMDYYRTQRETGQGFYWVMEDPRTQCGMGVIGFNKISTEHQRTEIGFWILPEFQRKGFVREAAHALIQDAFLNQDFIRIEASAETGNVASCSTLLSLGFRPEGIYRSYEWNRGHRIDLEWFGLLRDEWQQER
jgi:ribosomal-protein-alanine N-acetyltransferase